MKHRKRKISLFIAILSPLAAIGALLAWQSASAVCNYWTFPGGCARWQTCSTWPEAAWTLPNCYTGMNACCYCETELFRCRDGTYKYRDYRRKIDNALCNTQTGRCISMNPTGE